MSRLMIAVAMGACLLPAMSVAAPHPLVAGFERFHAAKPDATGGQLLLSELGCVSCHQSAAGQPSAKPAPILDGVGTRLRMSFIRRYLADPQAVKPGSTMPALLHGLPVKERADQIEVLVHYLASTGPLKHETLDVKVVGRGRDLYSKVGCVACHGSRDAAGLPDKVTAVNVPMGDLKAKYTVQSLSAFLANPLHTRPGGRMPKLLDAKEAKDVACYLLQGLKAPVVGGKGTTRFAYYEGNWDKLPDFGKWKPKATGVAQGFDLSVAKRPHQYGIRFQGVFQAAVDGEYRFALTSDDGSLLRIGDKVVVNNDGIHAAETKQGKITLTKGVHAFTLDYFQGAGEVALDVEIETPGLAGTPFGNIVAATEADLNKQLPVKAADPDDDPEPKPDLVAKGKELFGRVGCANCHQLGAKTMPRPAKVLSQLKGEGGCLSPKPAQGSPFYSLSEAQRAALQSALQKPVADPSPAGVVARTMTAMNCYACHVRNTIGGPEEPLNPLFLTVQPEMGDEGRVPPPLDGVGAKMAVPYFRKLLDQGVNDRPYMHTRMPGFGLANVPGLIEAFNELDKLPAAAPVKYDEVVTRVKYHARHLVGANGFGCIKCHTFKGEKAEGVQGIDMTLMPVRLKHDWFRAYVANPIAIRPGTRMPAAFENGKSPLTTIFNGSADAQIEAMWLYLSDGQLARPPIGSGGNKSIPLTPTTSAIIYRNFIEGAGARGIAVGYPEKAHLAFDANELRLAMLWTGAFMNAGRHWTDRGIGFEGPYGDNVLRLPTGVAFATLATPETPWPKTSARQNGYKFRGYKTTPDDRPTFLYSFNGWEIEDFPNPEAVPANKDAVMKRRFQITAAKSQEPLYFRAAVGKIESPAKGTYRIDDAATIKIEGADAITRPSEGKTELLIPVRLKDGQASFVIEYSW